MAKYILFDTETTGNQPNDRIIQMGLMVVHNKEHIDSYETFCFTQEPIKVEAMEVHHITPSMIQDAPPITETTEWEVLHSLNQPENYLIAHHIEFDLKMIEKEGFENHYTLIDTLRCAKHLLPDSPYHRLQYLRYSLELYKDEPQEAKKYHLSLQAHHALSDVIVMKLLLSKLVQLTLESYPDKNPLAKMAELTQTPVLMKTFKFGKYKSSSIEEIAQEDRGYLKWMRNNLELDADMQYTLDYYLG